jgi:hypothetical protein
VSKLSPDLGFAILFQDDNYYVMELKTMRKRLIATSEDVIKDEEYHQSGFSPDSKYVYFWTHSGYKILRTTDFSFVC